MAWDDAAHAGLKQYGMYAASTSTVQNVLGAIFGDMDALFTVQDGYEATLPFEIRATVMIDYASADEDAYNTLYVAGLELAIDLWRTEADETLTHVLGLYYMSDPMNIGDNNDSNDVLNTSALYLDLSWILGPTAKVKVDLSDYPLETLLNDMVLSSLLGGGEESGTGSSEAVTAAIDPVADPDKATVLLNVFSRSIALKASAGFLKLVIDLIAPDMTNTLEEMLPNLAIHAQIDAAPYDITIGASLFDNEGNGLIDLGITLNLFNTEEKTEGLQIGFGSLESYAEMSAERLHELAKGEATGADYMYYHGMFTRVDEYAEDGRTYYKQGGEGEKGYAPIEEGDDPAKLAEEGKLFVLDNETYYEPLKGNNAVSATPVEDLYVEIPAGYIMLEDADDYAWASGGKYYEKVEGEFESGHKYYYFENGEFKGLNNYYATREALYERNGAGEFVEVTDTAAIEEGKEYYVREEVKPTEPEEPSGDGTGDGTGDGSDESGSEQEPEYKYTPVLELAKTEPELAGKEFYEEIKTYSGTKLTFYYYNYNATNASGSPTQYRGTYPAAPGGEAEFVDYDNTGRSTGGAKLYVSYSEAVRRSGAAEVNSRFGITADEANTVRYAKDTNGGHKAYSVFGNYQTLLALDLGVLLGGETNEEVANDPTHEHTYQDNVCTGCGEVDALGVIVGGLQSAGLKTVELGGTLSLDLTFSDVLNWTRQMTRLMEVDGRDDNYFQMLLASLAQNSAEFVSMIGLDVDLALQLNVEGLIGMLPELLSMPEGATPDVASLLPAILAGAKIYLEVAIDTNFYGESIIDAEPIKLWVDVTDELYLNIYITAPDLGRVVGLAEYSDPTDASTVNTAIGDFFAQGVKIENLINLGDLLSGAGGGSSEAVTAAEGGSGIIVDIGQASTGLLSEDIWGVLDLILGQVLFARDMVSVGITENLIAELIAVLVPEFDEEDLVLLPTFTVTDGDDTSGINLNVGGGSLGLTVNLGVKGGFNDFSAIEDLDAELIERLIGAEGNNTYGIDSFDTYLRSVAYMTENKDGTFLPVRGEKGQVTTAQATATNAAIVLSTEEYALAVYASPEEAWLGDRYEIVDFDADGNPVFGSWVRDENGALETEGEAVEGEDNHTYRYTLEPVADEIAYKNAFR